MQKLKTKVFRLRKLKIKRVRQLILEGRTKWELFFENLPFLLSFWEDELKGKPWPDDILKEEKDGKWRLIRKNEGSKDKKV